MKLETQIRQLVRDVPDFPVKGIMFKDITPVLHDPDVCEQIVQTYYERYQVMGIDAVIGIESRGFFFGSLIANRLKVPFIPARKKGKLPYETISAAYSLEYGEAVMEIHKDAVKPGWKVLIHDDLLATGGTASASASLVRLSGASVAAFSFVFELKFLKGREKINIDSPGVAVDVLVSY